jgi:hypothetical protein
MKPPANVTRFFVSFNFLTPSEIGQSVCKTVSLSVLRFCPNHGTACA